MIYISTACVHVKNIKKAVDIIAKSGVKNIELSGGTQYYEKYLDDLLLLKDIYNLQYTSHGYFPPLVKEIVLNLASCNDEIYEKSIQFYLDTIKVLERLGGRYLSAHAGFYLDVVPEEIGRKISLTRIYDKKVADLRFCQAVKTIKKVAEKAGISFLIENNVLSYENFNSFQNRNLFMMTDSATITDLQKQLDFKLLLDVGHLKVSAKTLGLDYKTEFRTLITQAKWLHLHENDEKSDQHREISKRSQVYSLLREYKQYIPENVTIEVHAGIEKLLDSYCVIEQLLMQQNFKEAE